MADWVYPPECEIPVDYIVRKGVADGELKFHDADGKLVHRVSRQYFASSHRRIKTIFDAAGNPLVTAVHHESGWEAYKGNNLEAKDRIFRVPKVIYSPFKTEMEVLLADGDDSVHPRSSFRLKGSPFNRSCTIYRDDSIAAQANPMYKLGKVIVSRHKFRLTVYPGTEHTLVIAMLVVFFGESRLLVAKKLVHLC